MNAMWHTYCKPAVNVLPVCWNSSAYSDEFHTILFLCEVG